MKNFTYNLFHNWHVMRWVRLILGIGILVQAIYMNDMLAGMIACFFLFQAITNTGCCGVNSCSIPTKKEEKANR